MLGNTLTPEELTLHAALLFDQGDIDSALHTAREAVRIYSTARNLKLVGFTLATVALRLAAHPARIDEALKIYEEAADAFSEAGVERQALDALFSAGIVAAHHGRKDVAASLLPKVGRAYEKLAFQERESGSTDEAAEIMALAARAWKEAYLIAA